jgi:hypothetical protein
LDDAATARLEKQVADRLHALVRSDLMSFVGDESDAGIEVLRLGDAVTNTVSRWVGYVRRVAEEAVGGHGLAVAVLFAAALSEEVITPESLAMFGDESATVVDRARRELFGLLDVLYGETASELIAAADLEVVCPDDVHVVIGAVSVSLAPVDA